MIQWRGGFQMLCNTELCMHQTWPLLNPEVCGLVFTAAMNQVTEWNARGSLAPSLHSHN